MAVYVIPCGAAKLSHPAPARELYTGAMFRHTLAAARALAGTGDAVLILSAEHGLVDPAAVIAPYEQKMGQPGSVTAAELARQAAAARIGSGAEVYALLPAAYFRVLDEALRTLGVYAQDLYEGTGGIGGQRHVNAVVIHDRGRCRA